MNTGNNGNFPILGFLEIQVNMILGRKNRIFPGKYENSQINLCGIIQYNERSIVI